MCVRLPGTTLPDIPFPYTTLFRSFENRLALAQRCNLELRLSTYYLPAFPVPSDHTLDSGIRSEARDGLARRLETQPLAEGHDRDSYAARLETELGVIIKMGFPGYFLIVADFINWAKDQIGRA